MSAASFSSKFSVCSATVPIEGKNSFEDMMRSLWLQGECLGDRFPFRSGGHARVSDVVEPYRTCSLNGLSHNFGALAIMYV